MMTHGSEYFKFSLDHGTSTVPSRGRSRVNAAPTAGSEDFTVTASTVIVYQCQCPHVCTGICTIIKKSSYHDRNRHGSIGTPGFKLIASRERIPLPYLVPLCGSWSSNYVAVVMVVKLYIEAVVVVVKLVTLS